MTGIVLVHDTCLPLEIQAEFRPGRGKLYLNGPIGLEIKVALLAAVHAITDLESFVEGFNPLIFMERDLHIHIKCGDIPVIGESYGLALCMSILSAALKKSIPEDLVFTGGIGPAGEVLPVREIAKKRLEAAKLGFRRMMLPVSQLDMLNMDIIQCPVKNVLEAFSVTFYGEEK